MRNKQNTPLNKEILLLVENLPYFSFENLSFLKEKSKYLQIALSRLEKRGDIIRLKKGFYTSNKFVEKMKNEQDFSLFLEFLATKIYLPSYLSLDYVLSEYNILTEMPQNLTLVAKKKSTIFSNKLGIFIYHKLKDSLFRGFETKKNKEFLIPKATKSKALFDFLYLRKKIILNEKMAEELRLNLESFNHKEKNEFKYYIDLEGSKKMAQIYSYLFK